MNRCVQVVGLVLCIFPIPLPSFAQSGGPVPDFLRDLNQDGEIDFKDLLILIEKWGLQGIATPTPTFTTTPVTVSTETTTPTQTPSDTDTPTETPTPTPLGTPTHQNSFTVDLPLPAPLPLKMIRIPAGSFMMGSPATERSRFVDEGPLHQVNIAYDFYMSETEVTQAQWKTVMGSLPECDTPDDFGTGDNHPVYCISWIDCQDLVTALNTLSGEGTFRLPTEAEWEYACRAGTTKRFYFGDSLGCSDNEECEDCEAEPTIRGKSGSSDTPQSSTEFESKIALPFEPKRSNFMWFCANGGLRSHPVRSLRPNAFGLYDMSGNVLEWVQDSYNPNYIGAPTDGSAWIGGGDKRVKRGGGYDSVALSCRSAHRIGSQPTFESNDTGFRVAWTP